MGYFEERSTLDEQKSAYIDYIEEVVGEFVKLKIDTIRQDVKNMLKLEMALIVGSKSS